MLASTVLVQSSAPRPVWPLDSRRQSFLTILLTPIRKRPRSPHVVATSVPGDFVLIVLGDPIQVRLGDDECYGG